MGRVVPDCKGARMCGIAGMLKFGGERAERDELCKMIATDRHRGPDADGIHVSGAAGLAHARLSIIDLECGAQPMSTIDGRLWITFNGEIFNYIELREKLASKGHQFATRSDTEVILNAYREYRGRLRPAVQWPVGVWTLGRSGAKVVLVA